MSDTASTQLEAIHAMMASGHRSVRVEPHTLLLWGLAAAFLILVVDQIFTPGRFPEVWARSLAANSLIATVLIAIGILDFRLTRRARRKRDESLSFVQLQVIKIWWLLVGLIVVINIGMNFFGGGYMFYGIVLAIMGLAFYINGLFSQAMLSWIGALLIVLGLASVALVLPFALTKWLAAAAFGLGFPLLAMILPRTESATPTRRVLFALAWLAVVLAPGAAVYAWERTTAMPHVPVLSLADFRSGAGAEGDLQIVRLPAGTKIPVRVELSGDVLQTDKTAVLPMSLAVPIEIAVRDEKPDGRFRVGEDKWKHRLYNLHVRASDLSSSLTRDAGPMVQIKVSVSVKN
jgi:hypothetical protein